MHSTGASRSREYLPYLLTVFLGCASLFVWLIRTTPAAQSALKRRLTPVQQEQLRRRKLKNDPRMAEIAPQLDYLTKRPSGADAEPFLVVFIGHCTKCSAKTITAWDEEAKSSRTKVLLVALDAEAAVNSFLKSNQMSLPIISDPSGKLAKAYNAFWFPRAYGIDRSGKVSWIQDTRTPFSAPLIIQRFKELIEHA